MLLADATSKEQVEAALAAGDKELLDDIEYELGEAKRGGERYLDDHAEYAEIDYDYELTTDTFVDEVIRDSPGEYDLAMVPRDVVKSALRYVTIGGARYAAQQGVSEGPFEVSEHVGGYFSYPLTTEILYYMPDQFLPENHEFIPEDLAREFWDNLGWGIEWDETDHVASNTGHGEGDTVYITAEPMEFFEWAHDVVGEYVDSLIERDPKKAAEMFLSELPSTTATAVRKATALDDEELLDLAHRWFTQGTDKRDEVIDEIEEFAQMLEPSGRPHEVIATIERDDLKKAGVTKGTLWEEAPWKLIKLEPADLRYEGTRMRHCVGDKSMGYVRALSDGDIEIWSLRSRANKPRFTLEVDYGFYECEGTTRLVAMDKPLQPPDRECRGNAILQLKGKANRTPGYVDRKSSDAGGTVKWPEEVYFWAWLFDQLDVDPAAVADFNAYPHYIVQERLPLRPNRSFNEPCQPREVARGVG